MTSEEGRPRLFVGLGNPGKVYALNRHNFGEMVVREFGRRHGWEFKEDRKFPGYVAKGKIASCSVHLLVPTTYMNLSGVAVRKYLDYYGLLSEQLFVVYDDVAFPLGEYRIRQGGSAGGHNGLKSIAAALGHDQYARLRMGIGDARGQRSLADYVLENFSAEEQRRLSGLLEEGAAVLAQLVTEPVDCVMNQVNRKKFRNEEDPAQGSGEKKHESDEKKPL